MVPSALSGLVWADNNNRSTHTQAFDWWLVNKTESSWGCMGNVWGNEAAAMVRPSRWVREGWGVWYRTVIVKAREWETEDRRGETLKGGGGGIKRYKRISASEAKRPWSLALNTVHKQYIIHILQGDNADLSYNTDVYKELQRIRLQQQRPLPLCCTELKIMIVKCFQET